MAEYRIKSTGEVKSQGEIQKMHPNTSLPRIWNASVHESLGVDPVLASPKPNPSDEYKVVVRNGVEQDADGNWVYAWTENDMFQEYTDDEGTIVTVQDQKDAKTAAENSALKARERATRDELLASTDHFALVDATLTDAMRTYRQALRDVPQQEGFPNTITWPTKPS